MREYTDDQREEALAALVASGGKLRATARTLGISNVLLLQWRDAAIARGDRRSGLSAPERKRIGTGDLWERASRRAAMMVNASLEALHESGQALTPTGMRDVAVAGGIAFDKAADANPNLAPGRKSAISIDQSQRLELPAGTTLADLRAMAAELAGSDAPLLLGEA